jgi:hypothetical protein
MNPLSGDDRISGLGDPAGPRALRAEYGSDRRLSSGTADHFWAGQGSFRIEKPTGSRADLPTGFQDDCILHPEHELLI